MPQQTSSSIISVILVSCLISKACASSNKGSATAYVRPGDDMDSTGQNMCEFDPEDLPERWQINFAAVNEDQWSDGSLCGKCARVTGAAGTVYAMIVDQCPSQYCQRGYIDLSSVSLKAATGYSWDKKPVSWDVVDCPSSKSESSSKSTPSPSPKPKPVAPVAPKSSPKPVVVPKEEPKPPTKKPQPVQRSPSPSPRPSPKPAVSVKPKPVVKVENPQKIVVPAPKKPSTTGTVQAASILSPSPKPVVPGRLSTNQKTDLIEDAMNALTLDNVANSKMDTVESQSISVDSSSYGASKQGYVAIQSTSSTLVGQANQALDSVFGAGSG